MKIMKKVSEYRYLIIGGSTKCGTTSLFNYLSDHPGICAGTIKETRFFLSRQNPLESRYRLEKDGIESYGNLFGECSGNIRMEATPDYLYSDFTIDNIQKYISGSRMIFILRDPVERLVSWYKFARQRALLDKELSFEEYVNQQMHSTGEGNGEQHMHALEQGRYSRYLEKYMGSLGKNRVLVLSFDDLKSDPIQVLNRICRFAEIDASIYEDYHFEVSNKTQAVKNQSIERLYILIRKNLRFLFHSNKRMMEILRWANKNIRYLMRFNQTKLTEVEISDELSAKLDSYYSDERAYMNAMFRR